MRHLRFTLHIAVFAMTLTVISVSCCRKSSSTSPVSSDTSPTKGAFCADSAYNSIREQLSFGPRVPGTAAHRACGDYIISKMHHYKADTVIEQQGSVTLYTGEEKPMRNILARFNSKKTKKILLLAHYDTRPWADQETTEHNRSKPVPGANDGGSGVAVLMEIARNLSMQTPPVGVDILFVDVEDSGNSGGFSTNPETWCLGTQQWIKHLPYYENGEKLPAYGILLDMVGGKDAKFHREYFSQKNCRSVTDRIWSEAAALGLDDKFINRVGGNPVVDDHIFITNAGIPTCNIIENANAETGSFPDTWHTLNDDLDHISKSSLDAVGKTVLNVIYKETGE